jgi:hypothetical protein
VLTNLQRREVEAERLRLPDQVLELAVGEPIRTGSRERSLHGPKILEERLRSRIGVRLAGPRPSDAVGDQHERPAMGCVRQRVPEPGSALRRAFLLRSQPRLEPFAHRNVALGGRQSTADTSRLALQPAEDVVGVDLRRCLRDIRRDPGIPVAVRADPASPGKERTELRRSGAGAGVQRRVEPAVHRGKHVEDRLVEQRHRASHLVERLGPVLPHGVRRPQRGDLLGEAATDLLAGAAPDAGIVELVDQLRDPPEDLADRSALRLGRMSRQHQGDLEVAGRIERRGRGLDRVGHGLVAPAAFPQRADALVLLREVDQLEVARERACHRLGPIDVEIGHLAEHPLLAFGGRMLSQVDRGRAEPLHVGEELRASGFLDGASEHRREEPHLAAERVGHPGT